MSDIPNDAIIGIKEDDFNFLTDYIDGKVTQAQLLERFGDEEGRICIPCHIVDGGGASN